MTLFSNIIEQIQLMSEKQLMGGKGVTVHKNRLKEELIVIAADCARKLTAFAKFSNDPVLAQEVKISQSRLRQVADTLVRDYSQIVYDRSSTFIAKLKDYGITAGTLTAFKTAIADYNAVIGKPRASRVEGQQITSQLKTLFETAKDALDNMDTAVEIVRLTQSVFYTGYKNVRKIIERNAGTLAVKGMVIDASNGAPVKGVVLSFVPDGNFVAARITRA